MAKERLDVLLVQKGLAESREKAQRLIMAGQVLVGNEKIDKAGTKVDETLEIRLLGDKNPFVSRGGLKLQKAFEIFPITMTDKVVIDIGASTGGFVDCALGHGAKKVYAIDVGYGQLAWKLRIDERVINMEKTNARYLTPSDFPEAMDWATTDVSFISLTKILPVAFDLLKEDGQMIALIKPQFEAGREHIGKKGVVREPKVHEMVLEDMLGFIQDLGFKVRGVTFSPIQGPEGNIEYLVWLAKTEEDEFLVDVKAFVQATFAHFTKEKG